MAVELTRKHIRDALAGNGKPLHVPAKYLIGGVAAAIVITYLALGAGLYAAGKKNTEAERRFADASQVLEAPPVSLEALRAELKTAQQELARLQGTGEEPIDPASDETTALLVRRAQAADLEVLGISRVAPAEAKIGDITYDVQGLRIGVKGANAQAIIAFLSKLNRSDPALIASLSTLDISEEGDAQAELAFSVYTKPEATPVAGAAP